MVRQEGVKIEVQKGDILEVPDDCGKQLLKYSKDFQIVTAEVKPEKVEKAVVKKEEKPEKIEEVEKEVKSKEKEEEPKSKKK